MTEPKLEKKKICKQIWPKNFNNFWFTIDFKFYDQKA